MTTFTVHTDTESRTFDTERDAWRWARRNTRPGQSMIEPRRVGGRYLSGYTDRAYDVLSVELAPVTGFLAAITVRWEHDDRVVTHGTSWSPRTDRELNR